MKIERFRVQNYKNLKDVTVEGLSDINVFFGQNSVGKSNTLEALALCLWLLRNARGNARESFRDESGVTKDANVADLCGSLSITPPLTPLDGSHPLVLEVTLRWESHDISQNGKTPAWYDRDIFEPKIPQNTLLICRIDIENRGDRLNYSIHHSWQNGRGDSVRFSLEYAMPSVPLLHTIHAYRRLGVERQGAGNGTTAVSHDNLKKALFYAYLSSDPRQKRRLEAIRRILAEPPFEFGLLDVALNPGTEEIDIGFVRSEGRLSIDSLGSGFQQLLLVLGQVFLNDSPLVALEEPEMNLSPQNQQHLLGALRRLMQDPAIALDQLFISTHSPYFEFAENFYDVTLDKQGHTQIARSAPQEHARHFAITPMGPDTGARLNSLNQVQLYDGVLDDLNLQRGDMVFFVKNKAGRWEIQPEGEVLGAMEAAWSNDGGDE